ncbi:MAG: phosphoadenosine phosphosulfate reductase family protein [Schwartzia sp.]|nr:phosphoadenosine phosphosulfate reductase family protein [Schwartzia sp. (in: firmicutes)]
MGKPDLHVVSFSGGKDSTAMLLRMLEEGMQVDIILFCDTGIEFPQLYEHIHKVERTIGREVTIVKSDEDFEYLLLKKKVNRKKQTPFAERHGMERTGYSWAGPKLRWCTERLKNQPRERYLRKLRAQYDVLEYVGIAADETHRLVRKCNCRPGIRLPLVGWGMTEADCLAYCKSLGYDWGGLYEKFGRVSCWCCPLQPLKELRVLYREFPELWMRMKKWDAMTWRSFRADYSVSQLERRFDFEEEWTASGHPIGNKAFYAALKGRLEEKSDESEP